MGKARRMRGKVGFWKKVGVIFFLMLMVGSALVLL